VLVRLGGGGRGVELEAEVVCVGGRDGGGNDFIAS